MVVKASEGLIEGFDHMLDLARSANLICSRIRTSQPRIGAFNEATLLCVENEMSIARLRATHSIVHSRIAALCDILQPADALVLVPEPGRLQVLADALDEIRRAAHGLDLDQ
jgi:hypothetical protein